MRKNYTPIYSLLVLTALLFGIFYFMMPQSYDKTEAPLSEFSTKRALETVKIISAKPHFVGSKNHEVVAAYLQKELQNLGLQTSVQEGFTMTEKGTLVKSKNILTTIKVQQTLSLCYSFRIMIRHHIHSLKVRAMMRRELRRFWKVYVLFTQQYQT